MSHNYIGMIDRLRIVGGLLIWENLNKETMTIDKKLEELKRKKVAAEKKLIAAQHKEKQLEHELKRLTRSERTHRLCTRAGMLESFLKEPTLLTDKDVMELLTFIFHGEAAQKKLDELIEERRKTLIT